MTQSFSHGELAVLSAYQTAGGSKLSEKAIHPDIGVLLGRCDHSGRMAVPHGEGTLWHIMTETSEDTRERRMHWPKCMKR
jgi:hypothetical protein